MLLRSFSIYSLLFGLSLVGRAQSIPVAPETPSVHRFYVGLGAYTSDIHYLGSRDGLRFAFPVQTTIGYQLRPRLALQVGLVGSSAQRISENSFLQANGSALVFSSKTETKATSFSALGRYTFTRTPSHRLQVDGLGGLTLLRRTFNGAGTYPDSDAPGGVGHFDTRSTHHDVLLTGGISLRYRLSTRFEAVADGTVGAAIRVPTAVTASGALGIRYNFSLR